MQTKKSLQQRVASILDVDGTQLELKKTPTKKKDKDKKGEEVEGEEEVRMDKNEVSAALEQNINRTSTYCIPSSDSLRSPH